MMNSDKYIAILANRTFPELTELVASGKAFFFLTRTHSIPCIQVSEKIFI
jgi:hypothetical protein